MRAFRINAKLLRFEIIVTAVLSVLDAAWALTVIVRLNAVGVPLECVEGWLQRMEEGTQDVASGAPMLAWANVMTSSDGLIEGLGPIPLSAMGVLPFLLGVLCGVPIIGREASHRRSTATTCSLINGLASMVRRRGTTAGGS